MSNNKSKSVKDFSVYTSISKVVYEIFNYLDELPKDNFIVIDLKYNLLNILKNLSMGYNRYYSKDKIYSYLKTKDYISCGLSNLIFLNKSNILNDSKFIYFYNHLEENIKFINGLLKKFESFNK